MRLLQTIYFLILIGVIGAVIASPASASTPSPEPRWLGNELITYPKLDSDARHPRSIVTPNVVYTKHGGLNMRLDMYRPPRFGTKRPVVLLVHGGGWWQGSKLNMRALAHDLTARGFVVASIDYRLTCVSGDVTDINTQTNAAPSESRYCGWKHFQARSDVFTSMRWLRVNAARWGGDPRRISAVGISAGGHFVNELVKAGAAQPALRPRYAVVWSGPAWLPSMPELNARVVRNLNLTLGCEYRKCSNVWKQYSLGPRWIKDTDPKKLSRILLLASNGDLSVPAGDSIQTARRLQRQGAQVSLLRTKRACHGIGCAHRLVDGGNGLTFHTALLRALSANG